MTLEFGEPVKVPGEHIEILKQNLLSLTAAERKPENRITQIIAIKKELDKAIQERMRLSQIYCIHNSSIVAVPATAGACYYDYENNSCYDIYNKVSHFYVWLLAIESALYQCVFLIIP